MSNLKRYTLYIMNAADVISLIIAFLISIPVRKVMHEYYPFADIHQRLLLVLLISYVLTNLISLYNDESFLQRNSLREFAATLKMVVYVGVMAILYMYFAKISIQFSRMFMGIFLLIFLILDFAARSFAKTVILPKYRNSKMAERIVIIGKPGRVQRILKKMSESLDWRVSVAGVVLEGDYKKGDLFEGAEILADYDNFKEELVHVSAESVLIAMSSKDDETISDLANTAESLGKNVYLHIREYDITSGYRKLDQIGDCAVVSCHSITPMPKRQAMLKRILDIIISVVLLPFVAVIALLTFFFNVLDSHGPLFVHKMRVGRNGIPFYQLRFRTYRIDSEDRMKKGESGLTLFGAFLKKTHLDGLPVLLNVISGEMGIVGPRALSVSELLSEDKETRGMLSVRPGVIGYWSMDDRNTDKEDREYAVQWNLLKDLIITVVMILKYITFRSARVVTQAQINEELEEIKEYRREKNPMNYDRSVYQKEETFGYKVYLVIKRLADIILSLCGIIVLSPVLLLLTILVIADDGGSPFYGHKRIGIHGKRITIYKFRSMRADAGNLAKLLTPEQLEQYRNEFKIDNDPRITKIGNFIRKTSLDELPQLFNILFGSLSVIGPRPIVEEETKIYGDQIGKLLSVKPGLTGYWQAYARNNATYESGERQRMEMHYVDNQSLMMDIRIFFKTFASVLKKEGAQ